MYIILTMLLLGILLGFVGAGGAGFVIALLTLIFDIPIHTALGTSLAAMAFTTLSGAYSHYREGNIQLKSGLIVGALACVASFAGAKVAPFIPEESLHYLTAGMLFLSAVFMMIKLFVLKEDTEHQPLSSRQSSHKGYYFRTCIRIAVRYVWYRVCTIYSSRTFDFTETFHSTGSWHDNACHYSNFHRWWNWIHYRGLC